MSEPIEVVMAHLSAPFDPHDVKWKPSVVKQNRCLAMAYVDARAVMEHLDGAVGIAGWKTEYVRIDTDSVECRLSLHLNGEWITKADVGSTSEQPDSGDRIKAAYSDALKRAAVQWGVGRYLYGLAAQWVDYDPIKKQIVSQPRLPDSAIPKGDRPLKAPAFQKPEPAPATTLAEGCLAAIHAVPNRDALTGIYRQFEADCAENRFTADERTNILAEFAEVGKRFPKPAPAKA